MSKNFWTCSVSNALVAARLAVVCTDKVLYGRALAAFWHVHAALEAGIAKNASHEGERSIQLAVVSLSIARML